MSKTVERLLEENNWSLDVLADRAQLPASRVAAIADGRWTPSPAERQRIANALGVPIEDISWGHTTNPRNVRYHRFGLEKDFRASDG